MRRLTLTIVGLLFVVFLLPYVVFKARFNILKVGEFILRAAGTTEKEINRNA